MKRDAYDKDGTWEVLRIAAKLVVLTIAVALAAASCAALVGCTNRRAIYGVGSYGRHSLVPRVGLEGDLGKRTRVRGVWLPEFPVYAPGEPHQSSRAPSRELGAFEVEFSTEIP